MTSAQGKQGDFNFSTRPTIFPSEKARANWDMFCRHATAEWSGDIDATMDTMVKDDPFEIFHATGFEVRGVDAVRAFYVERMKTFQGQGFYAKQLIVADDALVGRGWFKGVPSGRFFGVMTYGKPLFLPFTLWIYFDEQSLIKGEAAYFDGKELSRQIDSGQDGDISMRLD
jgi:predicted ester cyclase